MGSFDWIVADVGTASYLADLLGRKKGVAIGILVLIVGVILQSKSTSSSLQAHAVADKYKLFLQAAVACS